MYQVSNMYQVSIHFEIVFLILEKETKQHKFTIVNKERNTNLKYESNNEKEDRKPNLKKVFEFLSNSKCLHVLFYKLNCRRIRR